MTIMPAVPTMNLRFADKAKVEVTILPGGGKYFETSNQTVRTLQQRWDTSSFVDGKWVITSEWRDVGDANESTEEK